MAYAEVTYCPNREIRLATEALWAQTSTTEDREGENMGSLNANPQLDLNIAERTSPDATLLN